MSRMPDTSRAPQLAFLILSHSILERPAVVSFFNMSSDARAIILGQDRRLSFAQWKKLTKLTLRDKALYYCLNTSGGKESLARRLLKFTSRRLVADSDESDQIQPQLKWILLSHLILLKLPLFSSPQQNTTPQPSRILSPSAGLTYAL